MSRANLNDLGRILFTSPGTDLERLAILRAAIRKVLTEPELMAEGALDVVSIPAQMKKDRPAQVVKVLAKPEDADRLERILFEETSTLGIRRSDMRRDALHRHFDIVETRYGKIQVKVAHLPGGSLRATPEYEDCRAAAETHNVPLATVTHEAEHAAAHKFGIPH